MLIDIVEVRPTTGYRLYLSFADGKSGEVDVASLIRFEGIFAALRDTDFFGRASVHPELGTVVWPNGADLDPDVLYALVTGTRISMESSTAGGGGELAA